MCDFKKDCGASDDSDETSAFCGNRTANCNFDINWCTWYNVWNDDFDWKRGSNTGGGAGTGPSGDATTGTGYFLYIDSSLPNQPYDRARLTSHVTFPASRGVCVIRFYYNMFGSKQMGMLRLFALRRRRGSWAWTWNEVWRTRGMLEHILTLSLSRAINVKFPLQPHQKYYITQYGERGFS